MMMKLLILIGEAGEEIGLYNGRALHRTAPAKSRTPKYGFGDQTWERDSVLVTVERRAVNETKWEVYNYYMGVR